MIDKNRFAKICAMMTSSFEGERSNAAERASSMLRAAGMTWSDVVDRAFAGAGQSAQRDEASNQPRPARGAYERHMTFGDYGIKYVITRLTKAALEQDFTEWERLFLESLITQGSMYRGATEKQWHSIVSMYNKYFPGG